MPNTALTAGNIGTKLAGATGTKITGLAVTQPAANTEFNVPVELLDQAALPANAAAAAIPPKVLFCGSLMEMAHLSAIKPNGPSVAPGLTAPIWPQNIFQGGNIPFSNGVWVKSCPAGLAFTLTTA